MTRSQLRKLVDDGVVVRLRRGVLVGRCLHDRAATDAVAAHDLTLRALLLAYPTAAASHESGALTLGLPVLRVPAQPLATRAAGAWRGGAGQRVRVAPLPSNHVWYVADMRCTSLARTVIDVARTSSPAAAAVVGDAALRRGVTATLLAETLDECAQWADVARARRSISLLDARSESPFESVSRALMQERHVPRPQLQQLLVGASGSTYRVDFYWEDQRLIGEADGRGKYAHVRRTAEEIVWAEKLREDDLREAGYEFIRWTYAQMLSQTEATIARIMRKLRR